MKKEIENTKTIHDQEMEMMVFYTHIVNASKNSVVIEQEWKDEGDNFKKLTVYDNNYTSIPTLGETTLINVL